jgi:hypothetical protein
MARIVRPLHGRLQVQLPYRGGGSGNYDLLRDICGERTRPDYNRERKYFEVARGHLTTLVDELPAQLGAPVEVVLHGASQTHCVEQCWGAKRSDTFWSCECACAGKFHGTGSAPPLNVGGGLYIETEYTTQTYTAWPDGTVTHA